jgi:hypothetical protein
MIVRRREREVLMATKLFDAISVNMTTGELSYPALPGFELDMDRVYRTAKLFSPFCKTTEQAVRQAIHQQLIAHQGAMGLERMGNRR